MKKAAAFMDAGGAIVLAIIFDCVCAIAYVMYHRRYKRQKSARRKATNDTDTNIAA